MTILAEAQKAAQRRVDERRSASRLDFADWFWLLWLVAFLALEIPAALWKSKWTLSAHVWKWFAVGQNWKEHYAWLRWLILAGITISTTLHFLFGTSAIPIIIFGIGVAWSIYYHYRYEVEQEAKVEQEVVVSSRDDEPITRRKWDKTWRRCMEILAKTHPSLPVQWRSEEATRRTRRATGIDRPGGWGGAVLSLMLEFVKSGGNMDFSWTKNIWKGVRGSLLMAVGLAVVSFLGAYDTVGEVEGLGVPSAMASIVALIVAALIPMARNLLKVKFGVDVAFPPTGRKR